MVRKAGEDAVEKPVVTGKDLSEIGDNIIDALQERLSKNIKSSSFYRLNDPNVPTRIRRVIRSGLPSFDLISARTPRGNCGVPIGRQMEVFGHEASGKTSLACLLAASAQKNLGWIIKWCEAENKLDPERARIIGLDTNKVLFSQPNCLEDTIDIIDETMSEIPERISLPEKYKNFGAMIVVDSVASLPSKVEIEGKITDVQIASFARQMSKAQRRITNRLSKRNITIVWINQIRDKIGMGPFKGGKTTYGGNALKFYCAQRWNMWSQKQPDNSGIKIHIENKKNQCGIQPYLNTEVYLNFKDGFDYVDSWINALEQLAIIEPIGRSYNFLEGPKKGSKIAVKSLYEMYKEDSGWFFEYESLIRDYIDHFDLNKGKKNDSDTATPGES
jgi:recombination protein RecA